MAHPVAAAAALALLWKPPGSDPADMFAKFNTKSAEDVLDHEIRAFNDCLETARNAKCIQYNTHTGQCQQRSGWDTYALPRRGGYDEGNKFYCDATDLQNLKDNTGSGASLRRYLLCSPKACVKELNIYEATFTNKDGTIKSSPFKRTSFSMSSYGDRPRPSGMLLNTTMHVFFNGTTLSRLQNGFEEWLQSGAVSNFAVACNFFKSFKETSIYMHDNGYSYQLISQLSWSTGIVPPPIIYHRYNKAANLVAAAAVLKDDNGFCNVFKESIWGAYNLP